MYKVNLPSNPFDKNEVFSFLKRNGFHHLSHLILLQDKQVYWAQDGNILISYKRIVNKLIVLGDPVGEERLFPASLKEFSEYCEQNGLKPIFYQVSPKYQQYYKDLGFRSLKVGEEGKVQVQDFSIAGKQGGKFRTSLNKFNREGFSFDVAHPPFTHDFLAELREVSDSWLGKQKEKGFSVVSFREDYVNLFPVALLYDADGKVAAFATLATDYKKHISIDLMRKRENSPNGTMDVLFVQTFQWLKENEYKTCSLGMAPLANVGQDKHACFSEKLMGFTYSQGNDFYNFKGLKAFKSKFAHEWEPKYIVYKRALLLPTFIQLIMLIHKNPNSKPKTVAIIKYLWRRTG